MQLQDAGSNATPGTFDTISLAIGGNPGSGTLSGTTQVDTVNGTAQFSNLAINNPGVGYTIVATSKVIGLSNATSPTFTIAGAGTPAKLAFVVQPGNQVPNKILRPPVATVEIQDVFGTAVTSSTQNFNVT